jgi:hypothetical protein
VLGAGDYFYATLIDTSNNLEIVKVTARATDTMTVVRAQDGTSSRAYNVNDRFELRPTAALFNEKADAEDVYTKTAADAKFVEKTSGTGAALIPVGTTAQRPASPAAGMFRFNTTRNLIEYYDATNAQWVGIGAFAATGGTVTTAGGYTIHTFTSSGTFTVLQGVALCDVLVVAGGGGGARNDTNGSGGGGGGGLLEGSLTLPAGAYTVTVGAGGAAGTTSITAGSTGNNSAFGSATANGGGGGGASGAGLNGGSGGGGGQNSNPGSATQGNSGGLNGFGNAGGTGVGFGGNGGGGGGAGAVGGAGGNPSVGGAGRSNSYSGSSATYAAGGNGQSRTNIQVAPANTGNGGSAGEFISGTSGGSGIVIVRYLTP